MLISMLHRTDEGVAAEPPQPFSSMMQPGTAASAALEAERTVITCKPGFQCRCLPILSALCCPQGGIGLEQHNIGCGYVLRFQVSLLQLGNQEALSLTDFCSEGFPRHGIIPQAVSLPIVRVKVYQVVAVGGDGQHRHCARCRFLNALMSLPVVRE